MANENNRDYSQEGRNPQEQQNLGNTSTNDQETGNENSFNTPEAASDANAPGFNSGTNPDRYDSVNDGSAEGSGAETFTETERYSAGNSDFAERNDNEQNAELIPDSDDLEDEDEFEDFEDATDDEEDSEEETRTPGL